jgi:uncharacterized membrane protein
MFILAAILLSSAAGDPGMILDRVMGGVLAHGGGGAMGKVFDKLVRMKVIAAGAGKGADSNDDSEFDSDDEDTQLEAVPPVPPVPPIAPTPPVPPVPPAPGSRDWKYDSGFKNDGDALITAKGKRNTVDMLHRIAQTAGWSMTLVGSPKERIEVDIQDADPRDALRQVLKQSGAMGVLKRDKLVVVASPDSTSTGMLVEQVDARRRRRSDYPKDERQGRVKGDKRSSRDVVRLFGNITVKQGQIVQGDVVCVGGSIDLESGSVVQGDAVAVGGSVTVNEGALVLGQAVAVLGDVDVDRGGQVMGEHVQVGLGKLFGSRTRRSSRLLSLGPFGLFPTIALFAIMYLVGLVTLRMWPERVRNVSHAMFESPVRAFTIGFLCWLLLLPLIVLLVISIVGIPIIALLPIIMFLSIVVGLSSLALRIGESLPAGPGQRFVPPAALGMGMTVLLLLAFVPWLGTPLLALLQLFALGASVGSRFGRALPPHVG